MGKSSEHSPRQSGSMRRPPGRPRKIDNWDAESLARAAKEYFDKCDRRTKPVMTKEGVEYIPSPAPYSIEGLCSSIGVLRNTFSSWRKREDDIGFQAELIHQTITANRMEGALDGTQNPAFAQFLLKNNNAEHYRDKIELEGSVSSEAVSMFSAWSEMWKEMKQ
jgi:hypothetical protein